VSCLICCDCIQAVTRVNIPSRQQLVIGGNLTEQQKNKRNAAAKNEAQQESSKEATAETVEPLYLSRV
jgi:hypothetical protein